MTQSGNSTGMAGIEAELRNASVLENAGRLQEALQVYQGLIAEGCDLAEVYRRCGRVCWDLQHVDDALAALAKARDLAPEDPRAQVDMAEIKVALNDILEAEALLKRPCGWHPMIVISA